MRWLGTGAFAWRKNPPPPQKKNSIWHIEVLISMETMLTARVGVGVGGGCVCHSSDWHYRHLMEKNELRESAGIHSSNTIIWWSSLLATVTSIFTSLRWGWTVSCRAYGLEEKVHGCRSADRLLGMYITCPLPEHMDRAALSSPDWEWDTNN